MDDLHYSGMMLRTIRERQFTLKEHLTGGAVIDFTTFQSLRARLRELEGLEDDLQSLLKGNEENDGSNTA